MKLKKWVKITYILLILLCVYLVYTFLLYNSYIKYRNISLNLVNNGKVLKEAVFPDVTVSKGIYILDNLSIANNFESINKENDSWAIKDNNDLSYNFKIKEEENDNYRMYQYTISNLDYIKNKKIRFFTVTSKKREALRLVKNISKYVPHYEEIFLVNGNKKHGFIYKYKGEINAYVFINEHKYHFIFDKDNISYDYIIKLLASISIDD